MGTCRSLSTFEHALAAVLRHLGVRPRLLLAPVLTLAVAACGGESRSAGTPATSADPGGGNATYCAIGALEDPESAAVRRFNRAHREDGFTARFQVLHDYTRLPDVCDVALVDSVWRAHNVQTGLIADLTEHVEERKDDFFGASLELAHYDGRYWALPRHVDVGFLYYATAAGTPPFTWQEAYRLGRRRNGLVYSGARDRQSRPRGADRPDDPASRAQCSGPRRGGTAQRGVNLAAVLPRCCYATPEQDG